MTLKLSMEQAVKLDNLRETHAELTMSRTNMRAQIEKQLESHLSALRKRQSRLANECIKAGVSKTKVGRAMGTTDWKTITTILAETAAEFGGGMEAPTAEPYRLDGLDEDGSPSSLIFNVYKDRATGERMTGPVIVPLRKMGHGPMVTFDHTPESARIDLGQLYDAVIAINKSFGDDEPEPVVAKPSDDYAARFFVPDDDGEDD